MSDRDSESCCWEPLEATPESFNALLNALGLSSADGWKFVQVLDLDDDALRGTTAVAVILLYPTIPDIEAYLRRPTNASDDAPMDGSIPRNLFFVRQLVGGSCGAIAALHAFLNAVAIPSGSPLQDFVERDGYSMEEAAILRRSRQVVDNPSMREAHRRAAGPSSSSNSQKGQRQGRHFLTFIQRNGRLWELDGRREAPVCRGRQDFGSHMQGILMSTVDPRVHFGSSVLALVPTFTEEV